MKTNNKYYKLISKLLDENIDNSHHTDLYYTKKIAESYGESYTDLGNVNKYLRDFAKDVGVELDNKHHTRLWYLKRIADALYDGELEHNTENYYLRIISENINPTPPTPTEPQISLKFLLNGEPISNCEIIGTLTDTEKYYTDENGELTVTPTISGGYRVLMFGEGWNEKGLWAMEIQNLSQYSIMLMKDDETYQYDNTQPYKPLPSDMHINIKYEIDSVAKTITVTELS
jgi:hypothetical protein